jgi:hypothetical protein
LVDPCAQDADFVGGEPGLVAFFWRHELVCIQPGDELDERAVRAFSGNDCGVAGVAAFQRGVA